MVGTVTRVEERRSSCSGTTSVSKTNSTSIPLPAVNAEDTPLNDTDQTRQPEKSRFPRAFMSALIVFCLLAALIFVGWLMLYLPQ
jgi:hypothetical protein